MRFGSTMLLVLLAACGGGDAPTAAPEAHHREAGAAPHEHPAEHGAHAEHGAAHDLHAGHGGGGHMAQMAATRTALREELGAAYDAPVPGLDAADAAKGRAVYEASCASCHGATGKGDGPAATGLNPPPGDLTDAFHARYYSDAGRVHLVAKGSPGTAMPAFEGQLSPQEILDVYAFVRSLREPAKTP